ncbi:DUF4148 domain-containing protein [Pseudoduganella sp. SL102]|uniref:DUF4148 domain-containing protein n=1 Tax=Pseudoduganella sp. SL102 TaxID=2995154 RepID=UPI00248AEBF4|nr:DUF4148 domain-containing protein [Pseudoduganella sp. SL102]WBS03134.1 DUF4148 domain-containing protein [Pseudoduganella sp. SL102]
MKTIAIALSVAALFASVNASATTQLTRAQVIADYAAAVASGNRPAVDDSYAGSFADAVSTKTREEVRAELHVAQQRGEILAGEQYPFVATDVAGIGKTRAEVAAELAADRRANPEMALEGRL